MTQTFSCRHWPYTCKTNDFTSQALTTASILRSWHPSYLSEGFLFSEGPFTPNCRKCKQRGVSLAFDKNWFTKFLQEWYLLCSLNLYEHWSTDEQVLLKLDQDLKLSTYSGAKWKFSFLLSSVGRLSWPWVGSLQDLFRSSVATPYPLPSWCQVAGYLAYLSQFRPLSSSQRTCKQSKAFLASSTTESDRWHYSTLQALGRSVPYLFWQRLCISDVESYSIFAIP